MNFKYSLILGFIILTYSGYGQDNDEILTGQISFLTSNNIYVQFDTTSKISPGDTLHLSNTNSACLLLKSKSSSSCVCSIINDCEIKKGDKVYFNYSNKVEAQPIEKPVAKTVSLEREQNVEEVEPLYTEKIRGRLSASTYSTISSDREDRHRAMSSFSINANHINDSKFSFNSYLNYRYILDNSESSSLQKNSILRVYNLGLIYDITPTLSATIGRNINPKISSVGAIDGLQVEKYFGKNNYAGAILGFRPDIYDYGFNSNLLQFGGYVGKALNKENLYMQTTMGFIEQRNGGETDRRYAYFQHSSTFSKNLNLFSSLEVDLYRKLNDETSYGFQLTNLYVAARYRFNRKINMMLSYDSRKRILYYETYQTEIERLLDDDIARQGIRARLNIRPFKNILAGASYSKRFQNDSENKSDNIYGYLTLSRIPEVGGRLSLTFNMNSSNYLDSKIASVRHSREFFNGRLNADLYYRLVFYNYTSSPESLTQNYFGSSMSYNINRKLLFSLSGELTMYNDENNIRIYARIVQRF
ncbi:hypothetical protein KO529_07220 [Arenibacter algicola]|uniref:hypothetical protein n=1 Tax=Arenibacter algicola TaxID=616991 RepID=UPI001C067CB4|nr:hypothetical protein [Arenibacter algicola]MBU2904572.1 hypothetical protein [Arenibacter algicola]